MAAQSYMETLIKEGRKEGRERELHLKSRKNEISSSCYQICSFSGQVLQIISVLYNERGSKSLLHGASQGITPKFPQADHQPHTQRLEGFGLEGTSGIILQPHEQFSSPGTALCSNLGSYLYTYLGSFCSAEAAGPCSDLFLPWQ